MGREPWTLKTLTRDTTDVITLEAAKLHVRQDSDADDDLISRLIEAAIEVVEARARVAMVQQHLELRVPRFPNGAGFFALPRSPVRGVVGIEYLNASGVFVDMTASEFAWDDAGMPCRVFLSGTVPNWPTPGICRPDAVRVTYTCGPESAGDVSPGLVSAAMLMIGHLYENREAVVTGTIATKMPDAVSALIMAHEIPNGDLGVIDG